MLTGRVVALTRFISRLGDKCRPFFQLLKGKKEQLFEWNDQCQKAFSALKEYLSKPPLLTRPEPREELYIYLTVPSTALSSVLVWESQGQQRPIYYVGRVFHGTEERYPILEKLVLTLVHIAGRLRPYFQAYHQCADISANSESITKSWHGGRLNKVGANTWGVRHQVLVHAIYQSLGLCGLRGWMH